MSKETGDAAEHGEDHSDCLERTLKAELGPEEVCQEHQEETSFLCEETTGDEKAEKVADSEERLPWSEDRGSEKSLVAPQAAGAEVPLDVQGCDESGSSPPVGSCQLQAGGTHV